jgi:hypothetical protein
VSLALSLSAYERWLDDEDASTSDLLNASFEALSSFWSGDIGHKESRREGY